MSIGTAWMDATTDVNTNTADFAGYTLGMRRVDPAGNVYLRCKGNGGITQYQLAKIDPSQTVDCVVIATAAATDEGLGAPQGATAVASGNFFWLQVEGVGKLNCQGAVSKGDQLAASGTGGAAQTAPFTGGTKQGVVAVAIASQASGNGNLSARFLGGA